MPNQCCRWELLAQKGLLVLTGPPFSPRRDYAAIVFFANNRFETGKKKLQYLSFGDFAFCAELMIQNWTLGAVGEAPTDPGAWTPPHTLRVCFSPSTFSCRPPVPSRPPPQPFPLVVQCPHIHLISRERAHYLSMAWGKSLHLSDTLLPLPSWGATRWWARKAKDVAGGHFISHPNSLMGLTQTPRWMTWMWT